MRTLALLAAVALAGAVVVPAHADPAFTVRTMHFDVVVGPAGDQHCDIVGDLYTPAVTPAPAILTTNGFGGSEGDPAGAARVAPPPRPVGVFFPRLWFGGGPGADT